MKVLQINQSDISGGAGIAGYRLHEGLLNCEIDSKLLVGKKTLQSVRISSTEVKYWRVEKLLGKATRRLGLNYVHTLNSFDICKHEFYQQADTIHFHNLHTGYFNYLAIPKLTRDKPAVYTIHDMWSFTGHCAYSFDCDRWKISCGQCPDLQTYPDVLRDSTAWEWKLKDWVYSRSNITIVTISNWLTKQVSQSMLNRFPIHFIPNGIDTDAYQPLDKEKCRFILDIPRNKKVLMFGADNMSDIRKGGDLLFKTLSDLPKSLKNELVLLTFGRGGDTPQNQVGIDTVNLGYVSSDRLKSVAYSAADLFIFPTRADNLPLVLQESMACGTPMVSFNVGGVPDLVRHNITGYLAALEDTGDLSNGIVQLLEDSSLREKMSHNCRETTLKEYPLELQAKRYIDLYKQVLPAS